MAGRLADFVDVNDLTIRRRLEVDSESRWMISVIAGKISV
jgi:hypothetical protein